MTPRSKTYKRKIRRRGTRRSAKELFLYQIKPYTESQFKQISKICNSIPRSELVSDEKAVGRLMHVFEDTRHPIYNLIYNPKFLEAMRVKLNNPGIVPCMSIPIEYRVYNSGSYMDWHRDTQMLSDQNQYECVLTLTNTSDSLTMIDYGTHKEKIRSVPNSLIVVRANGIRHAVSKTTKGERTIVKFTFMTAPV
jgi:hypothetical protein